MSADLETRLRTAIRAVPDFPKPGILFRDITPVMEDPALSTAVVDGLIAALKGQQVDAIAGIESRGFLYGMPMALKLGVPFITVRKKGKLPWKTVAYKYDLEYGSAEIEMHIDTVKLGMRVLGPAAGTPSAQPLADDSKRGVEQRGASPG